MYRQCSLKLNTRHVLFEVLLKLEEDKNQLSRGLDPWNNPTGATSTLHYLLQEKERAQAQEQLQIYHHHQQQAASAGFTSFLQQHQQHRRQHQAATKGGSGDGSRSSGESTPVAVDAAQLVAAATAFGSGRIVRSAAGRKDRHSKVCTARGLRDRRVRLAAHTAIRFYDVQDRLGYDRPSKAVDWLIRNAKAAIEELPDRPDEGVAPPAEPAHEQTSTEQQVTSTSSYGFGNNNPGPGAMSTSSFLHSLGGGAADQVSDNVKSLFPSSSNANEEYGRGSPPDLLSRTTSSQPSPQELCLTLQSNNNNIFGHDGHHGVNVMSNAGGVPGWPDHVQRMPPWHQHASENNGAGEQGGRGDGGGYMFGMPPPRQGALDQSGQLFSSHGEPLQSSGGGGGWAASARAWLDPLAAIGSQPTALSGPHLGLSHLVAGGGGFMGFLAPAAQRLHLQGDEEQGSEVMRRD
ncbi:hypothetical protein BRADI_2g50193v3 [Brachypodium distachyon]|uniref:TCP domain-containing protein n=1 Tax=Brachypodium distachyon TaxID=15368 RepID=A0A2K2DF04_BRADI|nr:hypothetical protein BRADI_2g50193v3 [Brachypodium distachyon]